MHPRRTMATRGRSLWEPTRSGSTPQAGGTAHQSSELRAPHVPQEAHGSQKDRPMKAMCISGPIKHNEKPDINTVDIPSSKRVTGPHQHLLLVASEVLAQSDALLCGQNVTSAATVLVDTRHRMHHSICQTVLIGRLIGHRACMKEGVKQTPDGAQASRLGRYPCTVRVKVGRTPAAEIMYLAMRPT